MEGGTRALAGGISYEADAEVRGFLNASTKSSQKLILIHRVTSSIFTLDARFVLTGSDDGNVRIWKARASEKLGVVTTREKSAMEYRDSLRDRWKTDKEVSRVAR